MLAMTPIRVRLGQADYSIPVLNNRKSKEWRDKLYAALAPIVANFDFGTINLNDNHEQVSQAMSTKLSQELIAFPTKLADLLFEYAGDVLPKEEILDNASDEQIALAFSQVAEVGYPFFFHLWATKRALAIQAIPTTTPAAVQ
ncbi:MAG TPA: hypothetical protein VKE51_34690 [Vicinamibacterales bacterium]|nr:hypothetical protein [Vicinamibacterales bacterium]